MKPRKSRAKWEPGPTFRSLRELLDYIDERELAGARRPDIMVYGPWSGIMCPAIGNAWSKPNHRGVRPTSATILLNMPFAVVESCARNGRLRRAIKREESKDAGRTQP